MAKSNPILINAIGNTISKLKNGAPYQWGHMGACNCGNLAQEITHVSKGEIHQYAMQRFGDWSEQLKDYCPTSGLPMDLMISRLLDSGLDLEDLIHLEKLSDPNILAALPESEQRELRKNRKEDVILYLEIWLKQLEKTWVSQQAAIKISESSKIYLSEVLS
ncbi:MAG: hypothetical protein WD398_15145 [Cyclobacteriaceae bacterium]